MATTIEQQLVSELSNGIRVSFLRTRRPIVELARQATPAVTGHLRESAFATVRGDEIIVGYSAKYGAAFESKAGILQTLAPRMDEVVGRTFDRELTEILSRG